MGLTKLRESEKTREPVFCQSYRFNEKKGLGRSRDRPWRRGAGLPHHPLKPLAPENMLKLLWFIQQLQTSQNDTFSRFREISVGFRRFQP